MGNSGVAYGRSGRLPYATPPLIRVSHMTQTHWRGNMTSPYTNDESDLGITHEFGEDTVADVVSTFPFARGDHPGDGNPQEVIVRKPRP